MSSVGAVWSPSALRDSRRQYRTLPSPPTPTLRPTSRPFNAHATANNTSANKPVSRIRSLFSAAYASTFCRIFSGSGSLYSPVLRFRSLDHWPHAASSPKYSSISSVISTFAISAGVNVDSEGERYGTLSPSSASSTGSNAALSAFSFSPEVLYIAMELSTTEHFAIREKSQPATTNTIGKVFRRKSSHSRTWSFSTRRLSCTLGPMAECSATVPLASTCR
mmetsp:Transcript_51084/g.85458  ORF Transcript_51084/g.85458 Transcript_51084/m.85458 type:complete len:221 (+) Transcript_51084:1422-2084(+)